MEEQDPLPWASPSPGALKGTGVAVRGLVLALGHPLPNQPRSPAQAGLVPVQRSCCYSSHVAGRISASAINLSRGQSLGEL